MKECPVCHAVMEEDERCPVCGEFILYEPPSDAHKESLARNAYTVRYLVRKLWLPAASLVFVIASMFLRWPLEKSEYWFQTNEQNLWWALLLALGAVLSAVFERASARMMEWKYTHEYARMQASLTKIILSILALFLTFGVILRL